MLVGSVKNRKWCFLIAIALLFAACQDALTTENKEETGKGGGHSKPVVKPYIPETAYGERFQSTLEKQYESLERMLDTISLYYDEAYMKSLGNNGPLRLEDFSTYFDHSKSRTITDSYGNEYETTLGTELVETAQVFLGELSLLKPDISELTKLDGVVYENGNLMVPELDMIINTNSPSGALMLELKNAELAGVEMEALVEDMNAVTENYLSQLKTNGSFTASGNILAANKSVYKLTDPIYDGGKVYYAWGDFGFDNIEGTHKNALKGAMSDWENRVNGIGGNIRFIDKTNDVLHQAFATIGLAKLRVMISGNLGSTKGMAIWGGLPGRTHLTINSGLKNNDTSFDLYRTARHELGHVLGLHHEHQRWDRDEYMTLPDKTANLLDILDGLFNYSKIKEWFSIPFPILKFKMVSVGTRWFSVYIPVPYIEWIMWDMFRLANGSDKFDYDSIMLYSSDDFLMKKQHQWGKNYLMEDKLTERKYVVWGKDGAPVPEDKIYEPGDEVPYNAMISKDDAETVKKLYEFDIWPWW